ncbi:MAG TPA: BstYI [Anaerolinea thermolimosa]|uniref:BstYI n=1 Tax=Anaerolinea thermolimosa TaxID=229919 RepID=A0A3D1JIT9_9CHLR|nr:BglII/BstYI family type II restriction endonuclease [Anaerolinea thermolimosa]GAP08017.1 restriction endonuclease BglII [Anaerolinea thermolimosa]HCE18489.1 BstYI [Anaerolinea thermolimosa]
MKIVYEYSHLGGAEILKVRYPHIENEINEVISTVKAERSKESHEKTKQGKFLFAPISMNTQFHALFNARGYVEIRDTYTIQIPHHQCTIPNAFKQVDFVKEKVLIEVQFGKYAFMFYDMAKFQYFFNENKADVGVEIVPSHTLHRKMSSGVSYGEQLVYDIERLKRHFPAVPVKVILIDADDQEKF